MYIPLKPLFSRHKGIGVQFTAVLIGIGIGALIGGGAVGGGTTEVFKDVGSNVLGKVGKKLVEDGVDMGLILHRRLPKTVD